MNREPLITYLGCGPDKPALQGGVEALPLPLRMGTQSLVFWIGFLLGMADISEIVPVARKLSDVTIGTVLKMLAKPVRMDKSIALTDTCSTTISTSTTSGICLPLVKQVFIMDTDSSTISTVSASTTATAATSSIPL